jgi:hypothetical protein
LGVVVDRWHHDTPNIMNNERESNKGHIKRKDEDIKLLLK